MPPLEDFLSPNKVSSPPETTFSSFGSNFAYLALDLHIQLNPDPIQIRPYETLLEGRVPVCKYVGTLPCSVTHI